MISLRRKKKTSRLKPNLNWTWLAASSCYKFLFHSTFGTGIIYIYVYTKCNLPPENTCSYIHTSKSFGFRNPNRIVTTGKEKRCSLVARKEWSFSTRRITNHRKNLPVFDENLAVDVAFKCARKLYRYKIPFSFVTLCVRFLALPF